MCYPITGMWVMQMDDSKVKEIEQRYNAIEPFLNERTRRLFAAKPLS
jgi:hypothetical protein